MKLEQSYVAARKMISEKIAELQALQEEAEKNYEETDDDYYYGKITAYENAIQVLTELHAEALFI